MLEISVDSTAVRLKLDAMPESIRQTVRTTVGSLAEKLRSHIVNDKLKGQVLKRQTGQLGDHIFKEVTETAQGITGMVYAGESVPYAAVHEYGKVFSRLVTMAWGRPVKNPKMVTFHYPERSFARSALADQREDIVTALRNAVMRAAKL